MKYRSSKRQVSALPGKSGKKSIEHKVLKQEGGGGIPLPLILITEGCKDRKSSSNYTELGAAAS